MGAEPRGHGLPLLAEDDENVELPGAEFLESFTQLRDASDAVRSPGAAVELDQGHTLARRSQIEVVPGGRRSRQLRGWMPDGGSAHDAVFTATVTPSRIGTRVKTKSGAAFRAAVSSSTPRVT